MMKSRHEKLWKCPAASCAVDEAQFTKFNRVPRKREQRERERKGDKQPATVAQLMCGDLSGGKQNSQERVRLTGTTYPISHHKRG